MIHVKVTTPSPLTPLIRQTPNSHGVWGNYQFHVNDDVKEFDWWFVLHNMHEKQIARGPKNRTVLITNESIEMKTYRQDFVNQFNYVITCQREIKHPRITYTQQGLPWMIGHMGTGSGVDPKDFEKYFTTYDTLKTMAMPPKTKLISAITSHKNRTQGQKKRLALIKALKEHFGDSLDVFGAGINYIRDKWDGIAPYKYHLALENSVIPDWWTEKLADTYLGFAFPFYVGCPNINKYFDNDAFIHIDVNDHARSIALIERAIAENVFEKRQTQIQKARELVLDKYNVFALMSDFCDQHTQDEKGPLVSMKIAPEKKSLVELKNKIVREIKRVPVARSVAKSIYRKYRTLRYGQKFNE